MCVIKLNKKKRKILTLLLTALNLTQITIGLTLFIVGVYVARSVGSKIFSERAEIMFVFTVIAMYGVNVIVQFITGLIMTHKCYSKAHKRSTSSLLTFWAISACNTVFNGLVLAALAIKTSRHIVRSIRHSLYRGIQKYLTDLTWKATIDHLQQSSECCGVMSSKDWTENAWILMKYVDTEKPVIQSAKKSENGVYLPVIPWSCCAPGYPLPCFHDQFQQTESIMIFQNKSEVLENGIYPQGCLDVLRIPIERTLISVILADTSLLIIQVFTILAFRILFTSSKNAVILGDEDGIAPGWIIGPSKEKYAEKLLEIMDPIIKQGTYDKSDEVHGSDEMYEESMWETTEMTETTADDTTASTVKKPLFIKNQNGSIIMNPQ